MNGTLFLFFYSFAHQSLVLDQLIVFLAVYFPYLVIVLAGATLLFKYKSWREFLIVFFTSGLTWILAYFLKDLIRLVRPPLFFNEVQALFLADGYAFPSGHAAFFFALAVSIFFFHKRAGYWFLFFAALISLARIMAGVHSPLDILGGFVLGALFAYLVKYIYDEFAYLPNKV